jgi:hypothetical protein
MILQGLLSLIKLVLKGIIALIPNLSGLTIPAGFMDWFVNIVQASAYFLPLTDMLVMFGIWMLVINFHIVWKIIQRLWDAIWP